MKAGHRYPVLVRTLAAAVALAAAAQGSGVPMCASLRAEAVAPCAMHTHGATSGHDFNVASLSAAPSSQDTCHADAASFGCAAGGACPTSGPAAPAWAQPLVATRSTSGVGVPGRAAALASYLAPPLSPPPQA